MDRATSNHHLDIVADIKMSPIYTWRRVKNFVTFLHTCMYACMYVCMYVRMPSDHFGYVYIDGFSSPDWSIGVDPQTVPAAENSGTGSIPTPVDVGTTVGLAAGGVGTNNAGPTSEVLFNRDLCRIISSYIPR